MQEGTFTSDLKPFQGLPFQLLAHFPLNWEDAGSLMAFWFKFGAYETQVSLGYSFGGRYPYFTIRAPAPDGGWTSTGLGHALCSRLLLLAPPFVLRLPDQFRVNAGGQD